MHLLRALLFFGYCLVLAPSSGLTCDICGCSSQSASLGLLPLLQRHFVGAHWQRQGYRTKAHGSELDSWEYFQTYDLLARWMPHQRWQVLGSVPFQYNTRRFEDGYTQRIGALGDVSLLAQFSILDPTRKSTGRWSHALQVGGGMKLPTGSTKYSDQHRPELSPPPAMQPGTGATDILLSGLYAIRTGPWGASLDGLYRFTGEGRHGYRFGPRLNGSLRLFYIGNWRRLNWVPHVGMQIDYRQSDYLNGTQQPESGGWAALGTIGIDFFNPYLTLGIDWQMPVAHEMSSGFVTPTHRFSVTAVFLFSSPRPLKQSLPIPFLFENVQSDTKP